MEKAPENKEVPVSKVETSWVTVLFQIYIHTCALYGLYYVFVAASIKTTLFCLFLVFLGTLGLTLGCHRLWAHRTYKAHWALRTFLAACHLLACNGSIHNWAVDHRVHHAKHGTPLDRYNYKNGFFFCHFASRCLESNADIERLKRHTDITDLEEDQVVYYQNWLYYILMPIFGLLLPINAPMEYWGESAAVSFFVIGFLRIVLILHASWFINSAFLVWGLDPSDRKSGDTWLVFFVTKSLWPQYHYLLPWDYRSGEYGTYDQGVSTSILRVFAALGWAKDLTTISSNGVKEALCKSVETNRPLKECLDDAKQILPDILIQDPANY
ncbi:acyl-CoA desaturase 4 [Cimex lectularius]|uniref:Fatty acid desaturase n=1 Tax=Cimex lectularius TaxID=79782 RepID=A0A8I6RWL0_CIMLE|nr:acyl-CoA desaturase 4 [Cimex lectularius]